MDDCIVNNEFIEAFNTVLNIDEYQSMMKDDDMDVFVGNKQDDKIKDDIGTSLIHPLEQNRLTEQQLQLLVSDVMNHFKITDFQLAKEVGNLFRKLDQILFFSENIGLYKISTHLLFLFESTFPGIVTNEDFITSILLICCIITQKYFVDQPFSNLSLSRVFSVSLGTLNDYEFWVLKKMDFCLPFRLTRE